MKFVTFERVSNKEENGMQDFFANLCSLEEVGILSPDGVWILPIAKTGFSFPDMNALIAESTPQMMKEIRLCAAEYFEAPDTASLSGTGTAASAKSGSSDDTKARSLLKNGTEAKLLSPIPVPLQDVICLGLNYTEHAQEAAAYSKESFLSKDKYPVYFSKRVFRSPADGDPVPSYEGLVDSLDYEAELAVIIGRDCRSVSEEEAADYVFGYTILNDFSARNLQTRHTQWYLGKSLDGLTPMGPCIVTADEFPFPPALRISSTVNGELRQNSSTDMLIFGIPRIISELSAGMTLRAGTIISTGTPKGVGMGFTPPRFLKAGDVVTCSVEGIGTLTNTIS